MSTAIITLIDEEDGVRVSVTFGPDGLDEESSAHALAAQAITAIGSPEELGSAYVTTEVCGHG